jgi:hypothetical protein
MILLAIVKVSTRASKATIGLGEHGQRDSVGPACVPATKRRVGHLSGRADGSWRIHNHPLKAHNNYCVFFLEDPVFVSLDQLAVHGPYSRTRANITTTGPRWAVLPENCFFFLLLLVSLHMVCFFLQMAYLFFSRKGGNRFTLLFY